MEAEEIITDEMINDAWGYANFGEGAIKRDVVNSSLLKIACGYITGHTAKCILLDLKLIQESKNKKRISLTNLGGKYLYHVYCNGLKY